MKVRPPSASAGQASPAMAGSYLSGQSKGEGRKQLLEMSPSLKHQIDQKILKAYKKAVEYAAAETGISESVFPQTCPYALEEALDKNFYSEAEI